MTRAELIIRGLSGEHLYGFLPGNDNRAAIARAVASRHHWTGPGYWCAVTREGFGDWGTAEFEVRLKERRSDAVSFITWAEILDVIARGCADGRRQAYETAYRAWLAAARAAHDVYRAWATASVPLPRPDPETMFADPAEMHRATDALIRNGLVERNVQGSLFDDEELAGAAS